MKKSAEMNYEVIALACQYLSYRDKLRLAQLLIQTARKEEENANPENRSESTIIDKKTKATKEDTYGTEYVKERLAKLKPTKRKSMVNSIKAMYQFRGGISDSDIEKLISTLENENYITFKGNRVIYS